MEEWQRKLVLDELDKLLIHPSFFKKERLRDFLRFVVVNTLNGDFARLKEALIGVEVYGRDPSYNPKTSPIVRTQAQRLRALLDDYYTTHGQSDRVAIRIPKGSYVAQFEFREVAIGSTELSEEPLPSAQPEPLLSPVAPAASRSLYWKHGSTPVKLAVGLLGLCLAATATFTLINSMRSDVVWSARPLSRLGGIEAFSAFSPDGQKLAFTWSGPTGDNRDIYVQDLKADTPTRLTSDPAEDTRPAWSPDGRQIAFIRLTGKGRKELDLISLGTGKESKITELEGMAPWLCIIPRVSWSRDGRYLFTSESLGTGEACGVVAVDVKTGDVRRITQPPPGIVGDLEPDVSPDGRQVAFLRNAGEMGGDIYVVDKNGGPVQRMTFDNRDIIGFCWAPDGKSLLVASRRGDGVLKLWQIAIGNHQAKQLTDGAAMVSFPAITPGGDRIAFTSYRNVTSIWRATNTGNTLLVSDESGNSNPQLSPDGTRLLYRSDRTGAFELWISDRDGRNCKRLTHFNGPMVNSPAWSPDGKQIAFECRALGHSDICLISSDGYGEAKRITEWSSNEVHPSWSRDGHFVYFASNYSGRWQIYKQAIAGGPPMAITRQGGIRAVESWDGRYVYVHRGLPLGGIICIPVTKSARESINDGSEARVFLSELTSGMWGNWDTGPDGIVFLASSVSGHKQSIAVFNPETGLRRNLFAVENLLPEGDRMLSVEPDGKCILFVKEEASGSHLGMLVSSNQSPR
ncbi:MAG: PD40 domain-containing protein [Acidobacteriaceae bacterium]|nr:PD40 domain-containing protein [Acidobacteriaceae bacterium]